MWWQQPYSHLLNSIRIFQAAISAYSCVCVIDILNLMCPNLNSWSAPPKPASPMGLPILIINNYHSFLLAPQAKILEVIIDSSLSSNHTFSTAVILVDFYLQNISRIQPLLTSPIATISVQATRVSLLHFCNNLICLSGFILVLTLYSQ